MFSIDRALEIDSELMEEPNDTDHAHDSRIGTFSFKMDAEMTLKSANDFLMDILKAKG